jgi:dodecin
LLNSKNIFMPVVKVIEIMSNSSKSWEDAAQQAIAEASKSLHNIKSIYIKDHSATVNDNKIKEYRITAQLSFELDNGKIN